MIVIMIGIISVKRAVIISVTVTVTVRVRVIGTVIVIVITVIVVVVVVVVIVIVVVLVPRRTPWRLVVSCVLNLRSRRHSCSRASTRAIAGAGQGKRGSSNAPATASTAAPEPAATALALTFLSDGDGDQGKVLFVVLRTLERWLSQKPNDDGLVFQASADCLSHGPIMIASRMRAGGQESVPAVLKLPRASMPKS